MLKLQDSIVVKNVGSGAYLLVSECRFYHVLPELGKLFNFCTSVFSSVKWGQQYLLHRILVKLFKQRLALDFS